MAGTVLKVIGASWQKTRIGTYILIGSGLLIIGAFIISFLERPKYNGTYCATAFWSKQYGFHIEYWKQQNDLINIPKGVARICYKDSIYENGWAQIEIETQRIYPDRIQAYGAGIIEGALTWYQVYNQWFNTIKTSCDRDEEAQNFCTWLRDLVTDNFIRVKEMAAMKSLKDHYWHQVNLNFEQLQGIEMGYRQGAKRARSALENEISFADFLLMNSAADLHELKIYYDNYIINDSSASDNGNFTEKLTNWNHVMPRATMITTILKETSEEGACKLLFGHSTAGSYASMLRIHKRYKFHYHYTANLKSNTVPGIDITFTGYPGILGSTDDFYIIKGRQLYAIVAGVAIRNVNLKLYEMVNTKGLIPLSLRVMAANRMAQNRRTWSRAMSRQPFTGSKQWLIIDLNKLKYLDNLQQIENSILKDSKKSVNNENLKDLIWIIEQLPGRTHAKDITEHFIKANDKSVTWLSTGMAYFEEMLIASRIPKDSYQSHLIKSDLNDFTSLEAIDIYLRNHAYRGDLSPIDVDSTFYGNIDLKLFEYNARSGRSEYHAVAGPIFIKEKQHFQLVNHYSAGKQKLIGNDLQNPPSSIRDDRLTIQIDDTRELGELEVISASRPIRDDIRAIALQQRTKSAPFKWSSSVSLVPFGHPNEWNFDQVSPIWLW